MARTELFTASEAFAVEGGWHTVAAPHIAVPVMAPVPLSVTKCHKMRARDAFGRSYSIN